MNVIQGSFVYSNVSYDKVKCQPPAFPLELMSSIPNIDPPNLHKQSTYPLQRQAPKTPVLALDDIEKLISLKDKRKLYALTSVR